jgi:hypothetical protein
MKISDEAVLNFCSAADAVLAGHALAAPGNFQDTYCSEAYIENDGGEYKALPPGRSNQVMACPFFSGISAGVATRVATPTLYDAYMHA